MKHLTVIFIVRNIKEWCKMRQESIHTTIARRAVDTDPVCRLVVMQNELSPTIRTCQSRRSFITRVLAIYEHEHLWNVS